MFECVLWVPKWLQSKKKSNPNEKRNVSCTAFSFNIHVFIECVYQPKNTPEGELCTRFEFNHQNEHFKIPGFRCVATSKSNTMFLLQVPKFYMHDFKCYSIKRHVTFAFETQDMILTGVMLILVRFSTKFCSIKFRIQYFVPRKSYLLVFAWSLQLRTKSNVITSQAIVEQLCYVNEFS